MSQMERRFQLLLDQERFDRLSSQAEESHCSVSRLIREALDFWWSDNEVEIKRNDAALHMLMRTADRTEGEEEDWPTSKAFLDAEFLRDIPS
ncbi:MAG TPA: hypothetical protein VGL26_11745 [Jatrophihabitans sp.]|jgi:hypothetical protein